MLHKSETSVLAEKQKQLYSLKQSSFLCAKLFAAVAVAAKNTAN